MTNKQALVRGVLSGLTVDDFQADKVLLDAEIDGGLSYDPSNEEAIDKCAIKILQSQYVESISEGGYTIKNSRQGIELKLNSLADKYGLGSLIQGPSVKGVSVW